MRITGDPPRPWKARGAANSEKITTTAAGYSSYGNQVGLATGLVHEIYHPGYLAKRMEVSAVMPRRQRCAENARPATLSCFWADGRAATAAAAQWLSKSHTEDSLKAAGRRCGGSPPGERKLLRLFRRPEAARLIKRCNDFGAGIFGRHRRAGRRPLH